MGEHFHAIVWLDHRDAKIFPFSASGESPVVLHSAGTGRHLQHKANVPGSGHHGVDREYFGRIVAALEEFGAILLTGPGTARMELKNFIDDHHPALAARIKAVETLDHPHDSELVALGRRFFSADDRIHFRGAA